MKLFGLFKGKSEKKSMQFELDALLQRAHALQAAGDLQGAIALYDRFIEVHPGTPEGYYKRANAFYSLQQRESALADYDRAININPDYADALCNRGSLLNSLERWSEALISLDRAVAVNPSDYLAHANRGFALRKNGRLKEALESYGQAIALKADYSEAHFYRGGVLHEMQDYESAVTSFEKAIEYSPTHLIPHVAFVSHGVSLASARRFSEALVSFDKAIGLKADSSEAYINRGNVLRELNRNEAALSSYDQAIALDPMNALAYSSRGLLLNTLQRSDEALANLERSIELRNDHAEAHYNYAIVLQGVGRHSAAVQSFDCAYARSSDPRLRHLVHLNRGVALSQLKETEAALLDFETAAALQRDDAQPLLNRGNILLGLKRYVEAIESYDAALVLTLSASQLHLAHSGRGFALKELNRFHESLLCYERALTFAVDDVEVFMSHAAVLKMLGRVEAAAASYKRAIELKGDYGEAFAGLGFCFLSLRQQEAAVECFDRVLALSPKQKYILGFRRYAKMQICDWQDWEADLKQLTVGLLAGEPVCASFQALALMDSAALQRRAAEIWTREECPPDDTLGPTPVRPVGNKISIGYFSADFHEHPVSLLTAGLFECHDRSQFEITAFAFGHAPQDSMRVRLERTFDRFVDVSEQSDCEVAQLARSLGIDIAVDLGGFTESARPGIFALRAAPIQMGYLGYLGTMGASYMDYIVADATLIPVSRQPEYAEHIIYLPSYQVNDVKRRGAEPKFTREQLGLPSSGFVYSCFNANFKIGPNTFASWMRILKQVPHSCLYLYAENRNAKLNFRKSAQHHGVDPSRLVFGGRLPGGDYLSRFLVMDLFLDTLPYNAGTTASDALWAGLPVLTCAGDAFAGRVAASVLRALEVPELITETAEEYEALAVRLALFPDLLREIRKKVALKRATAPLFDTGLFTRNLEFAYTQTLARQQAMQPPAHIYPQLLVDERPVSVRKT
jgi:protein O-GlcNAc transferase